MIEEDKRPIINLDNFNAVKNKPYYEISYKCLNCLKTVHLCIEKGRVASKVPCPVCGVSPYRLEKEENEN